MDTNNFFSFSRIALVLKREIMENWKTNLYRFIGIYAAFLTSVAVIMLKMSGERWYLENADIAFSRFCGSADSCFALIFGLLSLIYASGIMENMFSKEKRISFLMLPATMIEKFVSRFLLVTVGLALAVVLAILLAELTRYMLLPLFDLPATFRQSMLPDVFPMTFIHVERGWADSDMAGTDVALLRIWWWSGLLWNHSLYILGGSYWYKKPFFKTLGTIILVILLLVHVIEWIGSDNISSFCKWLEENLQWMTLNKLLSLGIAVSSAFTMFNWWLSYKLFTRSQIIKPKFRLL